MIVPIADVLRISNQPVDDWIVLAREDNRVLKVHYYGEGKDEHLQKIDGLEGKAEFEMRKRYSISNKWLTEGLLRPFDNIFSAKGKTVDIDIPKETTKNLFQGLIKDVKAGEDLDSYLKNIWKPNFIVDPAGLVFLEVKRGGGRGYLTQKSINFIRKMRIHGTRPEYVMFEADVTIDNVKDDNGETKSKGYSLHWFIDDAFYYRLKVWAESDKPSEIIEQLPNSFGFVPGVSNSNIIDTNRGFKISPIHKQVELLDKYLRNSSVHEIFLAKHGYPVFWAYGNVKDACKTCSGTGNLLDEDGQRRGGSCSICNGSGSTYRKDVTDVLLLNPPKTKDAPVIAPNVAGYNGPGKAPSEDQRVEEDWTKNNLYFSLWGTTRESAKGETATGRFIDVQPVNNRLNDFADIVDYVGTSLIEMFAQLYVPLSFNGASYATGRRFLIETPDQIWKKYLSSKKDGASETILGQLLAQYYEAEYQTNDMLREYFIKIAKIDPLPHSTIGEALALSVPGNYKDEKIYLSEYLNTKSIVEVIDKPLEALKDELTKFIKGKTEVLDDTMANEESDSKDEADISKKETEGIDTIINMLIEDEGKIELLKSIYGYDETKANLIIIG